MVKKKAELLAIADKEGIHINQTIAVGDGANDLPMQFSWLRIAFHAKPTEKKSRKFNFSLGLDGVLSFGLP
jgi:phosphoserine phosphatase